MPKHDTNNNHNVENMNRVLANDHQLPKDDKRSGSVRSFQFDKFNQSQPNYESSNYANQQQQPPQQPQQIQQQFYGKINVFEYVIDFKIWEKNIDFFLEIIRK